jgi:uncharacterized protein (UPF0216 family)
MSGIEREIVLETRISLINKHLPGTEKAQSELEGEIKIKKTTGKYHVIPRTRPRTSY